MKVLQYAPAALGAAALALLAAHPAQAQTDVVVFGGAGSSALLNPLGRAANSLLAHHYTLAKPPSGSAATVNYAYVSDPSASASKEKGDLFVTWEDPEGSSTGTRKIIFYISVDTTVGNRAYFNKNTIKVNGAVTGGFSFPTVTDANRTMLNIPTVNSGAGGTPDENMPTDVQNAVLGVGNANGSFNGAGSDVLPIDSLVATRTALALGYNSSNPIQETASLGSGTATPIAFSLSSRGSYVKQIGAEPVVVFVNKSDSTPGGLGSNDPTTSAPLVTNIDRFVLAGFVNGTFSRTSDLITLAGTPTTTRVSTYIREPISGTYIAFQQCIPASKEIATTQELNVSATANNPLNETPNAQVTGVTGQRRRAIGTGDMVKAISTNSDSLGYAFFSTGAFATSKSANTKYITVDGVDPLLPNYVDGTYPLGTSGGTATFDHIKDGSYPIWSILRLVLPSAPASDGTNINILTFIGAITPDDIVPFNQLRVFRSHRTIVIPGVVSQPGSNGNASGTTESGSDAGGAVYPINADLDNFNDTGSELTEQQQ